ncbi:hypothetical protein F2Q70_00024581 [Brassica cretica]|uniref:Uncharacterized protein n=2 Tax=Brassica cretica TaxID=69181 RepID=A0A8S9IA14_BRACR|nr:hypothetical protein F2Q68_00023902 [Brassica cretica]KAF2604094.1 hypothetical protein F2Q70_00024581 [Brassica cretica]KAF3581260.1 hypothetical protein DY000_02028658 [Brassica cretica]
MADATAIWQSTGAANPFFLSKEPVLDFAGNLVVDLLDFAGRVFGNSIHGTGFEFRRVVEIEFAGAVGLGTYILYPVKNVCSGLLVR